ncbi:MAG: 3-deoxy-7-phosphoheptulonate synthase [Enterobacterales bacterium]
MKIKKDNLNCNKKSMILSPIELINKIPITKQAISTINASRLAIKNILDHKDNRLLVIIGPCSIHDIKSAKEYANRLVKIRKNLKNNLEIVMRTYMEKPRTILGWKGLINDPYINNSFKINYGLNIARKLLIYINNIGLPVANEFLDVITPQYISDLISWGAIGARTTESQLHRELASGQLCTIGFKNNTNGETKIAIDAIKAAKASHTFLSINKYGYIDIIKTTGNHNCHIILRGGEKPNYKSINIEKIKNQLLNNDLSTNIMIDCSHANSEKNFKNQICVVDNICKQIINGEKSIIGVMIESNLIEGNQIFKNKNTIYGKSITDPCLGWEDTEKILNKLSNAVYYSRKSNK